MTNRQKKEYAIVLEDGTFLTNLGYYGNSPAVPLYSKRGAEFYIAGQSKKLTKKKIKIADSINNCYYDKAEEQTKV